MDRCKFLKRLHSPQMLQAPPPATLWPLGYTRSADLTVYTSQALRRD